MTDTLPPYPQTKESGVPWLGEIPAHWEVLPGFAGYRTKQVKNTGLIEDQVLSLSYGRIVIRPVEKLHGLVPASFETYQLVDPGNIIIRPTDLQNDWSSLRVGIARDKGIITSAYICLKTVGQMSSEYGYLLLNAYDLMKIFYGMGSGLRQNLDYNSDLKRMPILLPPPDEQTAIARYLDYVDRRVRRYIKAKRRLIEVLTEQKQAIIHQAVTRGLDPDVPMKESGVAWLGEVPAHWEVVRLKNVAEVQTGLTLGKNYQNVATAFYPYLRVANVQHGRLDLSVVKDIAVPPSEAVRTLLKSGDVLMTEGGDIDKLGRGCVWRGEIENCLHQNHVFAVRCNTDRLSPDFLVGLMVSGHGRGYFQLTAKQTTNLASTNSTTLRAFPVLLPPRIEQQAILSHVDDHTARLEEVINRTLREIDLLREYRTRLIADVVTGKVDVRGVAASLGEETGGEEAVDEAWDDEEALDGDDGEEMGEEVEA